MFITFRLTEKTVVGRDYADLIFIAWRCLYAELVHARVEKKPVFLLRAVQRTLTLFKSRLKAYGESWERWYDTRMHTSQSNIVPPHIMDGLVYIGFEYDLSLLCHVHSALDEMLTLLAAVRQGSSVAPWSSPHTARPLPRRPAAAGTGWRAAPRRQDVGGTPNTPERAVRPHDGLHAEAGLWMPASPASVRPQHQGEPDPETGTGTTPVAERPRDGLHAEAGMWMPASPEDVHFDEADEQAREGQEDGRAVNHTGPEVDLSGDAVTWAQAQISVPPRFSECGLSVMRNIVRDPHIPRSMYASHQVGYDPSRPEDLRFPDWYRVLSLVRKSDEIIIRFDTLQVPQAFLTDARLVVFVTTDPNHVVLYSRTYPGFYLYDNDSTARAAGVPARVTVRHMRRGGRAFALTPSSSRLREEVELVNFRENIRKAANEARLRAEAVELSD
jgi:hypothetical protein